MAKPVKRKGGSLIMVICVAAFCLVIGVIVTTFVMNNALAARRQRERTQAYYITLAGIETGSAALLKTEIVDGEEVCKLLNEYGKNHSKAALTDTVVYSAHNNSKAAITIRATNKEGTPLAGAANPAEIWVEVAVLGTYYNDSGEATEHAGRIRYLAGDQANHIREIANPDDLQP